MRPFRNLNFLTAEEDGAPSSLADCSNAHVYSTTLVCGQPLRRAIKDKWLSLRERNLYATALRACACDPCTYLVRGRRHFLEDAAEAEARSATQGACSTSSFDDDVLEEDVQE